jgi:uncharacterized protein
MSDRLPCFIDPILMAERRSVFSGEVELVALNRLADFLAKPIEGAVQVEVKFGKEGKRSVVEGRIQAAPVLACQNCMEALPWPVDVQFRLGVISSLDEVDALEVDCEPLLFQGEKLVFNDLIEDELLLAIPDYPKHDYDCLAEALAPSEPSGRDAVSEQPKRNPFSVLANLKKAGD